MARRATPDQLQAFGARLAELREENELSAFALSEMIDPEFRKASSTLRNYEHGDVCPPSTYVVLAIERALGLTGKRRGELVKLLGWPIPKADRPAVTRPSVNDLVDARVSRLEAEVTELRDEVRAVLRAAVDRAEPHPELLTPDRGDR